MGTIEINSELCKGCGYCAKYCPQKIIAIGKNMNSMGYFYAEQSTKDNCTGCAICALMCPDIAINVYKQ